MKKIVLGGLLASAFISTAAFSSQLVNAAKVNAFAPQSWYSNHQDDIITIASYDPSSYYKVQIAVHQVPSDQHSATVTVRNCDGKNPVFVAPGSAILCLLNQEGGPITLSANSEAGASGTYQIEKQ